MDHLRKGPPSAATRVCNSGKVATTCGCRNSWWPRFSPALCAFPDALGSWFSAPTTLRAPQSTLAAIKPSPKLLRVICTCDSAGVMAPVSCPLLPRSDPQPSEACEKAHKAGENRGHHELRHPQVVATFPDLHTRVAVLGGPFRRWSNSNTCSPGHPRCSARGSLAAPGAL